MANPNDTSFPQGRLPVIFMGEVNYADTSAKDLFILPANCVIVDGRINGYFAGPSNATGATLSVGVSPRSGGLGTEYLHNFSLLTGGSNFQGNVPWTRFGSQASNTWTTTNTAWTVGSNAVVVSGQVNGTLLGGSGPWDIIFEVIDVGQ